MSQVANEVASVGWAECKVAIGGRAALRLSNDDEGIKMEAIILVAGGLERTVRSTMFRATRNISSIQPMSVLWARIAGCEASDTHESARSHKMHTR
jgi:hypothetical protein